MRICYVGNIDSVHTRRWAIAFARLGHEIHVVYPGGTIHNILELKRAGVSAHLLQRHVTGQTVQPDTAGATSSRSSLANLGRRAHASSPRFLSEVVSFHIIYPMRLRRLLKRIRPDLLHAWYLFDSGCQAAQSGFQPLVVSSWGSDVMLDFKIGRPTWALKLANRHSLKRASLITATSKWLAAKTATFAPGGKEIHIVPFGVDCEQFRPGLRAGSKDGALWLGFAKHLLPRYGPSVLLEAFAVLAQRYPQLHLKMAGEGYMLRELEAAASELGVRDRTVFLGEIPHHNVPEFFASSDIAVMPTLGYEAFGVAALEASATGVPVVATRVGGVPEVVVDGVTGLLVEPGDVHALADALSKLIEERALRERMGKAGREFVLSHYRWEDNVAQMARIYSSLLPKSMKEQRASRVVC